MRCRATVPLIAVPGLSAPGAGALYGQLAAYRVLSYSVRVFVSVLKVLFVDVRVLVGLSAVTVLVLVLDVLMIVQDVRVRMRHVPVCVLMGVLCCGH